MAKINKAAIKDTGRTAYVVCLTLRLLNYSPEICKLRTIPTRTLLLMKCSISEPLRRKGLTVYAFCKEQHQLRYILYVTLRHCKDNHLPRKQRQNKDRTKTTASLAPTQCTDVYQSRAIITVNLYVLIIRASTTLELNPLTPVFALFSHRNNFIISGTLMSRTPLKG